MLLIPDDLWAILTIWQEARGEIYVGKVAVAEVIRNRMKRKYSSDGTASGTVLEPYQFSGWNSKDPNRIEAAQTDAHDLVMKECVRAWFDSVKSNFVNGAVLYYSKLLPKAPDWSLDSIKTSFIKEIGRHRFYNAK